MTPTSAPEPITAGLGAWIARHAGAVILTLLLITAGLVGPFLLLPPSATASQEPQTLLFDAQRRAADRFASPAHRMVYVVEARGGDLLHKAALLELWRNAAALRADSKVGAHLLRFPHPATGTQVQGLSTVADAVDAQLRAGGGAGLGAASQAQIDAAVGRLLTLVPPAKLGLSVESQRDPASGRWRAPALLVAVKADNAALGGGGLSATLGAKSTIKETYAREVLRLLRGEQRHLQAWGLAVDVNLTSMEQGRSAGPFIGLTIFAALMLVGLFFRSYWAVAIVGFALGSLILWLKGLTNLVGLKEDQILSIIVPIAMISFGMDFAFHALGRYREERARGGNGPRAALLAAMGGVLGALMLATATDGAAFLSNATTGIESLIQFGVGAALATVAAFVMLGIFVPLALGQIEARVGAPRRGPWFTLLGLCGAVAAALTAMGAVVLMVFVKPWAGVALLGGYGVIFILGPVLLLGRGSDDSPTAPPAAGAGMPWLGRFVVSLARWRALLLPAALALTAAAVYFAVQVDPRFDVKDFFSADSDFVVGLDKFDRHVGQQGGEPAMVYVEGRLARPGAIAALRAFEAELRSLGSERLARDARGKLQLERGLLELVDAASTRPTTARQLRELFTRGRRDGLSGLSAARARSLVWAADDAMWAATRLQLRLPGSRAQEKIRQARRELEPLVERLRARLQRGDPGALAVLSGQPITRQASLDAVLRAFRLSLPVAVAACLLLALIFMRSWRYAVVSAVPILLVVAWLYAFMYLAGYGINVVTATIGAISIGVGIDFAVHFSMRFREELRAGRDRAEALHAAGAGTGSALLASALSSVIGFSILALAPMPMFASYGLLTAVMIMLAAVASLAVLPSLLLLVTPRPRADNFRDVLDPRHAAVNATSRSSSPTR